MGYVYNGNYRRAVFTVNEKNNQGQVVDSTSYNIMSAFSSGGVNYPVLVEEQFRSMSVNDYNARLAAFYTYVESLHEGLFLPETVETGFGPYGTNTITCAIGSPWVPNS